MFYVVSGYCGPDNYTSDDGEPLLELKAYKTAAEVEAAYKEFCDETKHRDNSHHTFRVFEGVERKLAPVETVTKYELK